MNAFNQHPDQAFRVRGLHELLGMPTDEPVMNVTHGRPGRSPAKDFSLNLNEAATRSELNASQIDTRVASVMH